MGVSKDAEIIELKERVEYDPTSFKASVNKKKASRRNESNKKAFNKKRTKVDTANSYATEGILKRKYDTAREDPGFTQGKNHSFSCGDCWDENGRLKKKGV